ncbi:hypothetical protein BC936DRAFT_136974 [Jimgerdemannia flammicorona]|uniref:Uncharacterized protein n=1 Tax=Jimgerdemannia flammicorona TaxID=994334 RepID=A0A433CYC7_9FUNG|nr:hypothetical protein BC936DRAFT_136974 [Jimgerdemannia flammicorona]
MIPKTSDIGTGTKITSSPLPMLCIEIHYHPLHLHPALHAPPPPSRPPCSPRPPPPPPPPVSSPSPYPPPSTPPPVHQLPIYPPLRFNHSYLNLLPDLHTLHGTRPPHVQHRELATRLR